MSAASKPLFSSTHDERAHEQASAALRKFVSGPVMAAHRQVYERATLPAFTKKHGRAPDRWELQSLWETTEPYAMRSALRRIAQEDMYEVGGGIVERQLPDLIEKARKISRGKTKGSLRLNPAVEAPGYLTAVDIHCMPGNYHTELTDDDVYAGALYDRTITSHSFKGADNADVGSRLAGFVQRNFPDLKPKRILDIGCTVGHSTFGIARAFPKAELHAIDVAAPCLRWAHVLAEDAGLPVHFSQQNGEKTDFADGSFDLITSVIILHETSGKAIRNIFKEARRLLRPGGVMVHCESRQYYAKDAFDAAWHRWGTKFNAEPFMTTMHELELQSVAVECGFAKAKSFPQTPMLATMTKDFAIADEGRTPKTYAETLYVNGAVK